MSDLGLFLDTFQYQQDSFAGEIRAAFSNWKNYMGAGEVVQSIFDIVDNFASIKLQWLPADIIVATDGSVKFLSYMNNVHPERNAALYHATASLLQRTIPLFERVLATAAARGHRAIAAPLDPWQTCDDWFTEKKAQNPELIDDDHFSTYQAEKQFVEPKVPETFVAPPTPPLIHLRSRTLQVRIDLSCTMKFQTAASRCM
jgi:hypothetical protein